MNSDLFTEALQQLRDDELQALAEGQSLRLIDDAELAVGAHNDIDAMMISLPHGVSDGGAIRRWLVESAAELVAAFYQAHPISEKGFRRQVESLIQKYGAEAFVAPDGERADVTLFVDAGEVVAETRGNPRHPYGAFLELGAGADTSDISGRVRHWLDSGEAYRHYLSMNVCRFNC